MTYSELQAAIISWCQRSDLTSIVPTWITFAHANFNRKLRVPEMESRDSTALTTEYSLLPTDFLEVIRVLDEDGDEWQYVSRTEFDHYAAMRSSTDRPIYTIEDSQLRVYPVPTVSTTVTMLYYERIATLVNAGDTNWLSENHPDLYVYGSLIHARAWLHNDERLPVVKSLHDEYMADLMRRKIVATSSVGPLASEVPLVGSVFDITRG